MAILSKTLVDYRLNYFEVQELKRSTSASVIHTFKVQFARYGILEVLLKEGHNSAHLNLQHLPRRVDLSTRPQACTILSLIEKGEIAVNVCQALLGKELAYKQGHLLALLDWRNTPSLCLETSPVQRLMSRRTRTLLTTLTKLLEQKVEHQTRDKLEKQKATQEERYNTKRRPLMPLEADQAIRMKLPGDTKWSLGNCVKTVPNHSYEVKVAGRHYRRNRRQLRTTAEIPPSPSLKEDSSHHLPQTTKPPSKSHNA